MRHPPDLGAELRAIVRVEGPRLPRLGRLFLGEADRIEIRKGEAVGAVGEMPLRERRNPLFLRILTGLGEPDAEVNTAFWSGKKRAGLSFAHECGPVRCYICSFMQTKTCEAGLAGLAGRSFDKA